MSKYTKRVIDWASVVMIVVFLVAHPVLGAVEGRIMPVAQAVAITGMEPVGRGRTRIWGEGAKFRDCSFVNMGWRLGGRYSGVVAEVEFEEPTKDRDNGRFSFGPWLVHLTPEETLSSTAVTQHRCHPFWLTETTFFFPAAAPPPPPPSHIR